MDMAHGMEEAGGGRIWQLGCAHDHHGGGDDTERAIGCVRTRKPSSSPTGECSATTTP
jgi:hypothetical protein